MATSYIRGNVTKTLKPPFASQSTLIFLLNIHISEGVSTISIISVFTAWEGTHDARVHVMVIAVSD